VASKKRKKQRPRQRQSLAPTAGRPAVEPAPGPGSTATAPAPARSTPSLAAGISGPRRPAAAAATTGTIDIDARVPYFESDLRRVLITAAVMTALIVVGSLLIH
jgi:hypothetical protein